MQLKTNEQNNEYCLEHLEISSEASCTLKQTTILGRAPQRLGHARSHKIGMGSVLRPCWNIPERDPVLQFDLRNHCGYERDHIVDHITILNSPSGKTATLNCRERLCAPAVVQYRLPRPEDPCKAVLPRQVCVRIAHLILHRGAALKLDAFPPCARMRCLPWRSVYTRWRRAT